MECNRDEAIRAKEIAERKFLAKDIAGAKKFALKAQSLYPGLDGLSQMLATFDVYVSAENKVNGEADWYGILDVNPLADDETVRKQYRKRALMLHPDKNKSIGAEGAFKLISQAWSLLSDKAKRLAYDLKRNPKTFHKKAQHTTGVPSTPTGQNGFHNFAKSTSPHRKVPKSDSSRSSSSSVPTSSHKQKPATFWTVCHRCKMQYEYVRQYLNHNLLCPNCHEAFFAIEVAPPCSGGSKVSNKGNYSQQKQNSDHYMASKNVTASGKSSSGFPNVKSGVFTGPDSSNQTNLHWGPFSGTTGAASSTQAASMVQQAYEKVKRDREQAQAATKREEALPRKNNTSKRAAQDLSGHSSATKKRKEMEDLGTSSSRRSITEQMGLGTRAAAGTILSVSKQVNSEQGSSSGGFKPGDAPGSSNVTVLVEKARKEIRWKLNEWSSAAMSKHDVQREENVNEIAEDKERDGGMLDNAKQVKNISTEPVDAANGVPICPSIPGVSDGNLDNESAEEMSINVIDPDFHDFDKDRTEKCFEANQVWAVYDNDDGMPRYYAMIHNVISLQPFKMQISWLNSKTNSELGPLNWVGSGFSKTCGDFRIGKNEIYTLLNSFSHKVKWTKGVRGAIQIYPRKGDVWALYRNWSPEWNELTEDEVINKYDMVEVLEDYDEEQGTTVSPLVKVAGFKTVFHQHLDPEQVKRIPREETFRFSHQVPSYLLTGQEGPNAPKGCRELDPAATPLEFLQLIPGAEEVDNLENGRNVQEATNVDSVARANLDKEGNVGKSGV